jgi:predicted nucleotidyltransferase component of viral defense system
MLEVGTEAGRRRLRQISAATGLGLKLLSKEAFLTGLLNGLSDVIGPEYVMKGGTAISRAGYLKTPRFSEDIDLDYFGNLEIRDAASLLVDKVSAIPGFDVDTPRHQGKCHRIDLRFSNHWDERDRIRIDISGEYGEASADGGPGPETAAPTQLRPQFTEGGTTLMQTYTRPHLFMMKWHALAGRREGKDVFDIWGMYENDLRLEEVIARLNAPSPYLPPPADILTEAMHNLRYMESNVRMVSNSTNHFIPRPFRPEWNILLRDVGDLLITLDEAVLTHH